MPFTSARSEMPEDAIHKATECDGTSLSAHTNDLQATEYDREGPLLSGGTIVPLDRLQIYVNNTFVLHTVML
jgi:hypothetical protein